MKYLLFIIALVVISCNNNQPEKKQEPIKSNSSYKNTYTNPAPIPLPSHNSSRSYQSTDNNENEDESDESSEEDKIEDGTHSASVDYHNPQTGYSATYDLEVEVENGEVTEIDFPKGGYLNEDHITPEELDENGHATVEGEDGKTYDVQIDDK